MKGYFTLFLLFFSLLNFSQEKIKAYIDCRCDENYLKQETSFLEYDWDNLTWTNTIKFVRYV